MVADEPVQRSFAIFLYADVQWTTGDDDDGTNGLGGKHAQVGFNKGDGTKSSVVPESRTANVIKMHLNSNVGKPGVWIFEITGKNDAEISALQSRHITIYLLKSKYVCSFIWITI